MGLQNACGMWKTYRLTQLQSIDVKRTGRYRLENSMKIHVKEISMRMCVGFIMFRIRKHVDFLGDDIEPSVCIKDRKFLS